MVSGVMDQSAQPRLEPSRRPQGLGTLSSEHTRGGDCPSPRSGRSLVTWPPGRSDVVALICFGVVILLLCLGRSDALVAFTIACAVASGLSPRARRLVLRVGLTEVDLEIDLIHPGGIAEPLGTPTVEQDKSCPEQGHLQDK
jgi:hypothetical protein